MDHTPHVRYSKRKRDVPTTTETAEVTTAPDLQAPASPAYLDWLKNDAAHVHVLDLTSTAYSQVANPKEVTVQACILPHSQFFTLFDNAEASYKANLRLSQSVQTLHSALGKFLNSTVSKKLESLVLHASSMPELPTWISRLHGLLSLIDENCGRRANVAFYVDLADIIKQLEAIYEEILLASIDLEANYITLNGYRCQLGTSSRVICFGPDSRVLWKATKIIPSSTDGLLLIFDEFVAHGLSPELECGMAVSGYLRRFTQQCCKALNLNLQAEKYCPTFVVQGGVNLQLTQFTDGRIQIPLNANSEISSCNVISPTHLSEILSDCPVSVKIGSELISMQSKGKLSKFNKIKDWRSDFNDPTVLMVMIIFTGGLIVVLVFVCCGKCLKYACALSCFQKTFCDCLGQQKVDLGMAVQIRSDPMVLSPLMPAAAVIPPIQAGLEKLYYSVPGLQPENLSRALVPMDPNIVGRSAFQNR